MKNILQDFQTAQMKRVRETDKSRAYVLGLSSFVKGVLFIKVQETWVRNRWPEMEEEGREGVLRIQSFILSTLISYCLFAVQKEAEY